MRILAFDTALDACSAAILEDGLVLAARRETIGRGHAERLVPMLEETRRAAGLAYRDLDLIAVTTGPGTFTGVRIGLAAARGLALAADLPVLGVGTLEALAAGAGTPPGESVLAALDARRGEIYAQIFGPDLEPAMPPRLLALPELAGILPAAPGLIVGTGAHLAAAALEDVQPGMTASWHPATAPAVPDAVIVARRAAARAGEARRGEPPAPLYLRAADAKLPATPAPIPNSGGA